MSIADSLEKRCDELRISFLRRASLLPSVSLCLKSNLSMQSSRKVKLDCCQCCGIKFDSTTINTKVKSQGRGKKKVVKITLICSGCKSEAPGVRLPKSKTVVKKSLNENDTVILKKETKIEPKSLPMKKSTSAPILLTHRQKQASKSNRLSKMVAAMEKSETSKPASSLDAFLSSLR